MPPSSLETLAPASLAEPKLYVRADEHSVLRVGATRVMLDSVVASFRQGHSAETIQQQYPAASLEEIYGAIAWYLAHEDAVLPYLARQGSIWDREREKAERRLSPVVQRLRALQKTSSAQSS